MRISKQLLKDSISRHFILLNEIPSANVDLRNSVGQYICVSLNGYWETYLRTCIIEHYRGRSDRDTLKVIQSSLKRQYNLKGADLISMFSSHLSSRRPLVEEFMKRNSEFDDSITSIVSNKNKIAHEGRSGVSPTNVSMWLEFIESGLDGFDAVAFR